MLRRNLQLLTLTLFASFALAAPRAEALDIIIDDYTLNFSTTGTNTDLGGVLLSREAAVVGGSGEIRVAGGDLIITDDSTAGITADILYPAITAMPQFDYIDGTNNRFELVVSSVTGANWTANMTVADGVNTFTPVAPQAIVAPGIYTFIFNDFVPMVFTSIDQLTLTLDSTGAASDSIRISEFRAVPEPGSAALLTLGLLGLAVGSPRRRVTA